MNQIDDLQLVEVYSTPAGITVNVRVQPRASRNAITGVMGGSLKVSLTSPPVDGEANEACIAFFSKILSVAKNRISITNGFKGRNKVIAIEGLTKEDFIQLLKS
ncbi:MAG: hypothetical protein H6Q65_881 [Firmicutes bacterium]|nr:hypothetical protein [Bacillota bacterium]